MKHNTASQFDLWKNYATENSTTEPDAEETVQRSWSHEYLVNKSGKIAYD